MCKVDSTRGKRINKKIDGYKTELCIIDASKPFSLNISIGAWGGSLNNEYLVDLKDFKAIMKHHINQMIRSHYKKDKYKTHILVVEGAENSANNQMKDKLGFLSIELVVFFENRIEFGGSVRGEEFDGVDLESFTLIQKIITIMQSVEDWFWIVPSKK